LPSQAQTSLKLAWWGDPTQTRLFPANSQVHLTDPVKYSNIARFAVRSTRKHFQTYCDDMGSLLSHVYQNGRVVGVSQINNLGKLITKTTKPAEISYPIVKSNELEKSTGPIGTISIVFELIPFHQSFTKSITGNLGNENQRLTNLVSANKAKDAQTVQISQSFDNMKEKTLKAVNENHQLQNIVDKEQLKGHENFEQHIRPKAPKPQSYAESVLNFDPFGSTYFNKKNTGDENDPPVRLSANIDDNNTTKPAISIDDYNYHIDEPKFFASKDPTSTVDRFGFNNDLVLLPLSKIWNSGQNPY
jgi:hypothetical protein